MELEIYNAFVKAGVPAEEAKAAVESLNKEIDKRYSLHATQLATRGDLADTKLEIIQQLAKIKVEIATEIAAAKFDTIKWTVSSIFGAVALFATVTKLWH